jgi:hypothetical protein
MPRDLPSPDVDVYSYEDNAVLAWNEQALDGIINHPTLNADPTSASELLALQSAAVFGVVAALNDHAGLLTNLDAPDCIDRDAAIAGAAHRILVAALPEQRRALRSELQESLSHIPEGAAKAEGLAFGRAVAEQVLADHRDKLDFDHETNFYGSDEGGEWRPAPPNFKPGHAPEHGMTDPFFFFLEEESALWPEGPPPLTSEEYATALNEVRVLGADDSSVRTDEQTEIARFWSNDEGSYTPPGHLNDITAQIAADQGISVEQSAALFAQLNVTLADASIAAWKVKYTETLWRPITAIRLADQDGNPETDQDPNWSPLLETPNHPEYVSGHAVFAGAAEQVLSSFFGDDLSFSITSASLPGVIRHFDNFAEMAEEDAISRIYAGVHYRFTAEDGLDLGGSVARAIQDDLEATIGWLSA